MAGRIPSEFIDELLARVDIVEVIDQRVTLKKAGSNHKACCPFHNEKTPSFSVSQPKQFYYCFGCGAKGTVINFLMEYENMHFVDAVEMLADSVGMEVPRDADASTARDDSRPLYTLMESITGSYQQQLKNTPDAITYLKSRALSGTTVKRYALGFVPEGWDGLQKAFPKEEAALIKTGMLIKPDDGKRPYQRFRNRIMFPIRDRRGRVIGFGGRVLDNSEPKYLNSPETPLFHKGRELYGLYEARKAIQDEGFVIVVEGYMDVVALAEQGIDNAVATLGTAANQQHSDTLFRVVPNIVFCFDGDRAGRAAAWRALTATLPALEDGRDAHFLFLPEGEDPDSVVREHGAAGFRDRLGDRKPIIDYLYEHLASDIDTSGIGGKAQLAERAKPLLATLPAGIYRQLAHQRLESIIGMSLDGNQPGRRQPPRPSIPLAQRDTGGLTPMRRAILLALQQPAIVRQAEDSGPIIIDPAINGAELLQSLIDCIAADPGITTARLLERYRDTDAYEHLAHFASRPYWPDQRELDQDTARDAWQHCVEQLKDRGETTFAEKLDVHARKGLLSRPRRR